MKLISKVLVGFLCFLSLGTLAYAQLCVAPDNGTGTADLPVPCPFNIGPMNMTDGFNPGDGTRDGGWLGDFFDIVRAAGGSLGGENDQFKGALDLDMDGFGNYAGYHRTFSFFDIFCEMDHAPDRKSTRLNSSHIQKSRMPSSA